MPYALLKELTHLHSLSGEPSARPPRNPKVSGHAGKKQLSMQHSMFPEKLDGLSACMLLATTTKKKERKKKLMLLTENCWHGFAMNEIILFRQPEIILKNNREKSDAYPQQHIH